MVRLNSRSVVCFLVCSLFLRSAWLLLTAYCCKKDNLKTRKILKRKRVLVSSIYCFCCFFFGHARKETPKKDHLSISPFDSKQMVRPHSWRSPKDGPFASLRGQYGITNGGRSDILAAFFGTFLLGNTFSQLSADLSVTKRLLKRIFRLERPC